MEENNRTIYRSGAEPEVEFALEDILAEYSAMEELSAESERDSLAARSKRFVMEQLDSDCAAVGISSLDTAVESAIAENASEPEPENEAVVFEPLPSPAEPEPEAEEELSEEELRLIEELEHAPEPETLEISDEDAQTEYAQPIPDFAEEAFDADSREKEKKPQKEKNLSPIVAVLALIAMRRGQKRPEQAADGAEGDEDLPEIDPNLAARRYGALKTHLRLRGRLAVVLSVIMLYLTYAAGTGLTLTGALKNGGKPLILLLLVLELTIMILGLDVFTEGILSAARKKPGARTLVSASCIVSALDAMLLAGTGTTALGLPFCAVSALSMTCAIWGEYFRCSGMRSGLGVLKGDRNFYVLSADRNTLDLGAALVRAKQKPYQFVRHSEGEDFGDTLFRILTPVLLAAGLVLGALASLGHGAPKSFFHCVASIIAASAAFSAGLCVAAPFAAGARCFARNGIAVSGWKGICELGRHPRLILTDSDLFPAGTVETGSIRILEHSEAEKVISYGASVIAASGSCLSAPFADLLTRNGYTLRKVENFEPHDGGGLTAMVNGETVQVGSAGFMNLMGVRVPRKLNDRTSIYVSVNHTLAGIFKVNYTADPGIRKALAELVKAQPEPLFAIRDFNVSPQMLKDIFHMPTTAFAFPTYSECYRYSAVCAEEKAGAAAVLTREGVEPLAEAMDRGTKLYQAIRIGTFIAAAGCIFGLLLTFLTCWYRGFDAATAGNAVTVMLLWLIPTPIILWELRR